MGLIINEMKTEGKRVITRYLYDTGKKIKNLGSFSYKDKIYRKVINLRKHKFRVKNSIGFDGALVKDLEEKGCFAIIVTDKRPKKIERYFTTIKTILEKGEYGTYTEGAQIFLDLRHFAKKDTLMSLERTKDILPKKSRVPRFTAK